MLTRLPRDLTIWLKFKTFSVDETGLNSFFGVLKTLRLDFPRFPKSSRLRFISTILHGRTSFRFGSHSFGFAVQAGLRSPNRNAVSIRKRAAATWLQEDPKPAIHEQWACRIFPFVLDNKTQSLWCVSFIRCEGLQSDLMMQRSVDWDNGW